MNKCPNCAGENPDTQRFCGECGTPLPASGRTRTVLRSDETTVLPSTGLAVGVLFAQRYQTIEELGAGGMGKVYRVLDTKVGEEVALKIIKPEIASDRGIIDRFASELKLARQIVHRNVARMFDLNEAAGVPYITMEYVQGENLKRLIRKVGRLSPSQAVPIACQICDGLAEAHRLGILHRDLKPHNVMIDEEGQAKILDFGLARLLAQTGPDKGSSRSGTPAYVSPEQIKGLAIDARSDIYSLGVLMYEMLTGHTPFKAESAEELIDKHLRDVPQAPHAFSPGISSDLSDLVMKCLEKDPAERYQTAADVGQALGCLRASPAKSAIGRWIIGHKPLAIAAGAALVFLGLLLAWLIIPVPPPSLKSSVAVLKMPPASETALGLPTSLQDSLSVKLAAVQDLVVVPPLTVNTIETAGKDPRRIGRLLKADYLLEPSCRIESDKITFSASLINTKRNQPIRGYEFSRGRGDPGAVEEEFARAVATVLRYDIAEDRLRRSGRGVSSNLDARLLVHEGMIMVEDRYLANQDAAHFRAGVEKFKQALALDPEYALAYYALGSAYEVHYYNPPPEGRDPRDVDLMCGYYYQAYSKDPSSPETNMGLGWALFNRGDFTKSRQFIENALRLEPEVGTIDQNVGAFLRSIGLYKQALPYLTDAARKAPQDPEPVMQLAKCYAALGQFDKAAEWSVRGVALDPNSAKIRVFYATHLILAGRMEEAEKEIATADRVDPDYRFLPFAKALLAAARGDKPGALALKGSVESLGIGGTCLYLDLGMTDEALANIEAGIERGFDAGGDYLYSYPSLIGNPVFKPLERLPRFQDIIKRQKARYERELKPFEGI